jgi:hypothetical protein
MTNSEISENIQGDLRGLLEDHDPEIIHDACQIVVDNFKDEKTVSFAQLTTDTGFSEIQVAKNTSEKEADRLIALMERCRGENVIEIKMYSATLVSRS